MPCPFCAALVRKFLDILTLSFLRFHYFLILHLDVLVPPCLQKKREMVEEMHQVVAEFYISMHETYAKLSKKHYREKRKFAEFRGVVPKKRFQRFYRPSRSADERIRLASKSGISLGNISMGWEKRS